MPKRSRKLAGPPSYPSTAPACFLGLEAEQAAFASSRYLILPVPYDATTSYRAGARYGPDALIAASRFVEFYDEELGFEPSGAGICTLPPIDPDNRGVEATLRRIHSAARQAVSAGKTLVAIGGDHSISPALVRAHAERHQPIHILQFDAHSDLRDSYGGSRFSHACAARRMGEYGPVTGVGIRSMTSACPRLAARDPRFKIVTAREIRRDPDWIPKVVESLGKNVYISFDLDAFDPSIMPATGTPEPGGLLWYETLALLKEVARRRRIVGADVVELSPMPPMHAPDFLAARLVYKIIGYIEAARLAQIPR